LTRYARNQNYLATGNVLLTSIIRWCAILKTTFYTLLLSLITEVTIRIDIFYKTNYAKLFAWRFGLLLIAQARCLRQRGGGFYFYLFTTRKIRKGVETTAEKFT